MIKPNIICELNLGQPEFAAVFGVLVALKEQMLVAHGHNYLLLLAIRAHLLACQ